MKKHLTYQDAKSDKFWSIETNGKSFTVTYGKTGTSGTVQTKSFGSDAECMKEAEKLLKEKLKKGYAEEGGEQPAGNVSASSGYLKEWEEIVKAKDLPKALAKHFSYLADLPEFMPALTLLMSHAKKAKIRDNKLVIKMDIGKEEIIASPPANPKKYSKYPKSYQALMKVHEQLYLKNSWICLGNDGGFDEVGFLEESDWDELKPRKILVALTDRSDWWIYHPKEKNKSNEPTLHFCSHEDCGIDSEALEKEYLIGSLFIKKAIESYELKIPVPKLSAGSKETKKTSAAKLKECRTLPVKGSLFQLSEMNLLLVHEHERNKIHLLDTRTLKVIYSMDVKNRYNFEIVAADTNNVVVFGNEGLWIYKDGSKFKCKPLGNNQHIEAGAVGLGKIVFHDTIWLKPKPHEIPHLNIVDVITGERCLAEPIQGVRSIGIGIDKIVVQNQEHLIILNEEGKVMKKLKLRAAFPMILPIEDVFVSFDSNYYFMIVVKLSGSKPEIEKLSFPKGYRAVCHSMLKGVLSILTEDERNEKYKIIRINTTNWKTIDEIPITNLDENPAAMTVTGDQIELFFHHKTQTAVYSRE